MTYRTLGGITKKKMNKYRRYNYHKELGLSLRIVLGVLFLSVLAGALLYRYFVSINRPEAVETVEAITNIQPQGFLTQEEQIAQYICSKPWDCQKALKVARCESNLNPNAIHVNTNGTVDRGIFQINSVHKDLKNVDAFDWKKNIDYAVQRIYTFSGWTPWVCSRKIAVVVN